MVGAYRTDEIPRAHPLRRMRNELRRERALRELALEPLERAGTAELVERVLGEPVARSSPRRCTTAPGHPVLRRGARRGAAAGGRLPPAPAGSSSTSTPTSRCRRRSATPCCCSAADLSDAARARRRRRRAVAGARFDLDLVAELAGEDGLDELLGRRPGRRDRAGRGRPSATRSCARRIYDDVPWLRRRALHRRLAEALEARGATGPRWRRTGSAARDAPRALEALARGDRRALRRVHAYRDAAALGRQALELWPEGERGAERMAVLERHAGYAELAGELGEAARAQREVVAARRAEGAGRALADAERRHRRDLRAAGRPRARARRAPRGRRGVRGQRPARRGGSRAARRGRLPAERRPAHRGASS